MARSVKEKFKVLAPPWVLKFFPRIRLNIVVYDTSKTCNVQGNTHKHKSRQNTKFLHTGDLTQLLSSLQSAIKAVSAAVRRCFDVHQSVCFDMF